MLSLVQKFGKNPFAAFWTGQSLALLGGNVAGFALPTLAIALLQASPRQVAGIALVQALAFPVLGMPVAAVLERHRKRVAMMYADFARFLAVCAIPILFLAHDLTIAVIVIVAGLTAIVAVVRDVAAQAYVPQILDREKIAAGNARLELSNTAAQSFGPAVGGILMHVLSGPLTMLVDAFSYLGSAATLLCTNDVEQRADAGADRKSVKADIIDGLRFVFSNRKLARIALSSATLNLAGAMSQVVSMLFFYRVLHFSPLFLGLLLAFSNVGFVGVFFANNIRQRLGLIGSLSAAIALTFAARALLPMATLAFPLAAVAISLIATSAAAPIYNIIQLTYRQSVTPLDMQARMHATMRTINSVTAPLGVALGGVLASAVGLTASLSIAAALTICALFWLASPVPKLLVLPSRR